MIDAIQLKASTIASFVVDLSIYSDEVISHVLYWMASEYLIMRENSGERQQQISLRKKQGEFSPQELRKLEERLSRDFADYKLREIVERETRDIRTILYVKAFAEFEKTAEFGANDE